MDEATEETINEHRLAQAEHNRRSTVPCPRDGLIPRFFKGWYMPDDMTADVVYIDRMTGKIVVSYDGADPANTNPYYGATPDDECFTRKGLNISEMIAPDRAVVSVEQCRRFCKTGNWD